MSTERKGVITFKGNPLTLVGNEIKVGSKAPDFKLLTNGLEEVDLAATKGKTRIISVVPSLDTPVCDVQTKRFNEEASKFPSSVVVLTVSTDLPFAQARWCGATGSKNVQTLSDHRDTNFGISYGVLIKELRLLSRAIIIVGANDTVQYVEYVNEITEHPNYDKALNFLKSGAKA